MEAASKMVGFFYSIFFIMIYKFISENEEVVMEIQHFQEIKPHPDFININISNIDESCSINLDKKELYKLIGALHIIHKEMI